MNDKYSGMTVNERLYVSGLLDEFYKAVEEKNTSKVILFLKEIELSDISINQILDYLDL